MKKTVKSLLNHALETLTFTRLKKYVLLCCLYHYKVIHFNLYTPILLPIKKKKNNVILPVLIHVAITFKGIYSFIYSLESIGMYFPSNILTGSPPPISTNFLDRLPVGFWLVEIGGGIPVNIFDGKYIPILSFLQSFIQLDRLTLTLFIEIICKFK